MGAESWVKLYKTDVNYNPVGGPIATGTIKCKLKDKFVVIGAYNSYNRSKQLLVSNPPGSLRIQFDGIGTGKLTVDGVTYEFKIRN